MPHGAGADPRQAVAFAGASPISKNRQKYNVTKDSMNLLIDILKDLKFQYIFIDCPAGIDVGFINAIAGATESVIVTTPEITAIRDADRVAGLLEANGIYDVKLDGSTTCART